MRTNRRLGLAAFVFAAVSLALSACQTTSPGVKSSHLVQWTSMAAGTADTTKAAEAVLNDLGLQEVESSSTNVDGWARGSMADKTLVKVSIARAGEASSDVSVKVGSLGDPDLGADVIARIHEKLGIEPPPASTPPASTQPQK